MTVESNATWYWLRPDRQQVSGSFAELRNLLSARSLPRSTLVWAEPWPEWLPASEVAVLADALPPPAARPASEPPPRPAPPPLVRRTEPLLSESARPKAPLPRPPKFDPGKREANASVKLEPPRAQGAARSPNGPSPKAEAFLNSLSRKAASVKVERGEHVADRKSDQKGAAPPARSALPKLESLRGAAPKPLTTRSSLPKLDPAPLDASKAPVEAPAVVASPVEIAPVVVLEPEAPPALVVPIEPSPAIAPQVEVQAPAIAPALESAAAVRSNLEDLETKTSELETLPIAVPVDGYREPASPHAPSLFAENKGDEEPKLEIEAGDIVKVEEAPSAASSPADASGPVPVSGSVGAASVETERELLTLPAEHLVTEPPVAAAESSSHESSSHESSLKESSSQESSSLTQVAAPLEEFRAGDYAVHGPASTPGFFPAQPRRALTSSDAPVELTGADEPFTPPVQDASGRRAKAALWAVSSVCAVLALALGLSVRALRSRPVAAAVKSNVPAPTQVAPKPFECRVVAPAAKLATSIERDVEPSVTRLDDARVAIGFASAPAEAQGIVVDLGTLDVTHAFEEKGDARVSQVTATAPGAPRFAVQREALDFASPRALETEPASELGVAPEALVVRRGTEKKTLWRLPVGHGAEPRAARLADGSYRVVMRRGGTAGEVVVGKIAPDGSAVGDLVAIDAGVRMLGTPVVAANKTDSFVVFAGREQKSDPFRLRAAALGSSEASPHAADLPIAAADGNGAIAPFLTAAGDDRWLLQWTQGEVGRYRVFVQALNAELKPEGSAVAVSPMGANAGQGLVRSFGDKALSLFVLPVPGHDELWGAVLTCR